MYEADERKQTIKLRRKTDGETARLIRFRCI